MKAHKQSNIIRVLTYCFFFSVEALSNLLVEVFN